MQKSEQINELATALSKAQGQIIGAIKDTTNPFFGKDYADLQSVWEAIRKPLSDNGLSVSQLTNENEKGVFLETLLLHSSGQWLLGTYPVKPVKQDPQALGSAMTYARRYALSAIAGVAQMDDDANAASGKDADKNKSKQENPQGTGAGKQSPPIKPTASGAEFKPGEKVLTAGALKGKTFEQALKTQPGKGLLVWAREQIEKKTKIEQTYIDYAVYAESKGL